MKDIEQCFPVMQFIFLHMVVHVLKFKSVDQTIQMKAVLLVWAELNTCFVYFAPMFESADEIVTSHWKTYTDV